MRKKRLEKILELIREYDIENQEVLLKHLQQEGFHVTQATISRDIKELDLVKVASKFGSYKYVERNHDAKKQSNKYHAIFRESVTGIDHAGNTVVIKSHTGMANAACTAIDNMQWEGMLGSIAGDDTIFVVCRTDDAAEKMCAVISELVQ